MKNSKLYPLFCLITGLIIIAAGVLILNIGQQMMNLICYLGGIVVMLHAALCAVSVIGKRKTLSKDSEKSLLISSFINIGIGVAVVYLPRFDLVPVYIVFTLYILINAVIKLIDYFIDRRDNVSGRLKELLLFAFFFIFAVLMIFVPEMGKRGFLTVAGIYCIIYGAFMLWDFVFRCLPERLQQRFKTKLSLPMPVLISTLRPFVNLKFRQRVNTLDPERAIAEMKPFCPKGKETDIPPDMEVLIHVSSKGYGIMGHCDIVFEGKVYSYGSYDLESTSLFGTIGDGIFIICPKEDYIRFYVTATPREIYGYGFRLTEPQKQAVREEIAKIKEMVYPWKPPLEELYEKDPSIKGEAAADWGSKKWNCTKADFYKFKSGKMKTYFVVTSNCVMLADKIVKKACKEININDPSGVLTPGEYYDYLEHLLAMVGSPVFCRTIYNPDTTAGWKYTPRIPYSSPELEAMTETEANRMAVKRNQGENKNIKNPKKNKKRKNKPKEKRSKK